MFGFIWYSNVAVVCGGNLIEKNWLVCRLSGRSFVFSQKIRTWVKEMRGEFHSHF
jgi:hypothetical protein